MLFNVAVLPLLALAGSAIAAPHRMNVVHIPFRLVKYHFESGLTRFLSRRLARKSMTRPPPLLPRSATLLRRSLLPRSSR
ncbi:hypothetical protein B0H10DRAFT_1975158, partial [Mycena sp. CBHHK59/15]